MQTIRLRSRTGNDGVLHLKVPVGTPNTECEVTVSVPVSNGQQPVGYPARFFEETAGAWQGDFVRDQGQFEQRESL